MDVVGVGALNLDLIAGATALRDTPVLDLIAREAGIRPPLEPCTERLVDEPALRTALDCLDGLGVPVAPTPGGSAFNTVHALARMETGLRLGYVGVAGRSPVTEAGSPRPVALAELDRLGVDRAMVRTEPDRLCGVCLSVYDGGERTLLTHTGANTALADHVRTRFGEIAGYLAAARVVHVTSFLDPDGCAWLHRLLAEVRRRSPGTLIGFDPGHVWSCDPPPGALAIAGLCDVLLVNGREYADLVPRLPRRPAAVVVKRPDRVEVHRASGQMRRFVHTPLTDGEVEDATGAGDVFAAGLLAALARHQGRTGPNGPNGPDETDGSDGPDGPPAHAAYDVGVRLGMAAARHKLGYVGALGHDGLAPLARSILRGA
jgi:sugar/nucleoside kinase (ribokinase family)